MNQLVRVNIAGGRAMGELLTQHGKTITVKLSNGDIVKRHVIKHQARRIGEPDLDDRNATFCASCGFPFQPGIRERSFDRRICWSCQHKIDDDWRRAWGDR